MNEASMETGMGLFNRRKGGPEEQVPRVAPQSASQNIRDSFTDLAAAVVANPTTQTMNAFWKAVFELDTWHFLPDLVGDDSLDDRVKGDIPVEAMVVRLDGKRYIAAFTSEARALAACVRSGLAKVGDGYAVFSLERDAAAAYLCDRFDTDIDGVVFNQNSGEHGITTPLVNVPLMYDHCRATASPLMFDRLVRAAAVTNSDQLWNRLNHHLAGMERLFLVGGSDLPHSPQLAFAEERAVALLYTTPEHAARGARASREQFRGNVVPLIAMDPHDVAKYLRDLQRVSAEKGHPIKSVVINRSSGGYMTDIDDLCGRIESRGMAQR